MSRMKTTYDAYNREERALCAHLFRLLHEPAGGGPSPLARIVELLRERPIEWKGAGTPLPPLTEGAAAIYTEVALIRDAYHQRRREDAEGLADFMDGLVGQVMAQLGRSDCRLWSELPDPLGDPSSTHPRQIKHKAQLLRRADPAAYGGQHLGVDFDEVYGRLQGIFNAKPDLAIVLSGHLIVIEAKLTLGFEAEQLKRTEDIAALWASELLQADLGFLEEPSWAVIRLGAGRYSPDLSWEELLGIAVETWPPEDRSRFAVESAVQMLGQA